MGKNIAQKKLPMEMKIVSLSSDNKIINPFSNVTLPE
jgi:hypothetical protein